MKNWKNLSKRAAAMGLSLMMCAALLPGTAFAAKVGGSTSGPITGGGVTIQPVDPDINIGGGLTPVDPDINIGIGGGIGGALTGPCGHRLLMTNAKAATCQSAGNIAYYTCRDIYCGKYYDMNKRQIAPGSWVIPKTDHIGSSPVRENEKEPTATEDGSYDVVIRCKDCKTEISRETITIPAHEHVAGDAVIENKKAVTCIKDGSYDEVTYCTVCNWKLSSETTIIKAVGHHEWTTNGLWKWYPETNGVGRYEASLNFVCTACGNGYMPVVMLDRDREWGTITVTNVPATCGTNEKNVYTASITLDGNTYTDTYTKTIPGTATGDHNYGQTWDETSHWDECTVCHDKQNVEEHTVGEWLFDGDTHYHICEVCGEQLDTTDHTYVATVTLRPTETEEGIRRYDCTVCDHYYLEDIPATGSLPSQNPDDDVEIDENDTPLASGPVTRAEFVDYLWRHENQPDAAAATFVDVAADHEFAAAIGWAQANGLVLGSGSDKFNPDDVVTVAQVRTILTRYAEWAEMTMPELTTLTGEDNAPVLNCDEVLAEFFGA